MKVFYILADEMGVKKRIDVEKFEIGTYSRLFILEISDRQKGSERKKLYVGYLDTCNNKKKKYWYHRHSTTSRPITFARKYLEENLSVEKKYRPFDNDD